MPSQFFGNDHDGMSFEAIFSFHVNKHGNCLRVPFVLDCSFWGHKGVPTCQRNPQIPGIVGTGTPNLDPFFCLFF